MKTKLHFLLLLFLSNSISAQTWFTEGQTWSYCTYHHEYAYGEETIQIAGDTVFQGQECLIFKRTFDGHSAYNPAVPINWQKKTFGYEENDAVFIFFNGAFQKIYDLNLETGDTLTYIDWTCSEPRQYMVMSNSESEYNDIMLQKQSILMLHDYSMYHIVQKIGLHYPGGHLFMNEALFCEFDHPQPSFNYYSDSEIGVYSPFMDSCLVYNNVEDVSIPDLIITLYPNPAKEWLTIEFSAPIELKELILRNINGRAIRKIENDLQSIFIGDLASGIYLIELIMSEGNRRMMKWIKE